MKRIALLISLMLFAVPVYAAKPPIQGKYRWSIGIDAKGQWAAPNGNEWNYTFYEFKSAGTIYLADRFTDIWSFEFGYSWTDRKPRSFTTVVGQEYFGATAASEIVHTGKVRFKETYLDFYAHLPISKYVELMGGAGIGFARFGIEFVHSPDTPDPVTSALDAIEGRTDITGRVNLGAQALVTERVGLRLLFSYETLNNLTARNVDREAVDDHLVNNSYAVSLGIYWNFMGHDS